MFNLNVPVVVVSFRCVDFIKMDVFPFSVTSNTILHIQRPRTVLNVGQISLIQMGERDLQCAEGVRFPKLDLPDHPIWNVIEISWENLKRKET